MRQTAYCKKAIRSVVVWVAYIVLHLALVQQVHAQPLQDTGEANRLPDARSRTRINLNAKWGFLPGDARGAERIGFDDSQWQAVDLPHTWNAEDTRDDAPGYRLGAGWYRKTLALDNRLKGKRLFLHFEGANQVANVFVNGRLVGQHKGGYTAFTLDITDFVIFNPADVKNVVAVRVDNSIDPDIPPAPSADFNLYGGIYRDVWLVAADPVHIDPLDYGSPGIYIDTPKVSAESATVRVRGAIVNGMNQPRTIRVAQTVLDAAGRKVMSMESSAIVKPGAKTAFEHTSATIPRPRLWSPESPYLYTVLTELYDGQRLVDSVGNPLGFRWFSFDAAQGFFLNGKPYKLRGANRHQDYQGLGNAVPDGLHVKDLQLIKDMGLNWVLLAHYPQDPSILEAADRLGLLVWEEIPLLRQINTSSVFTENCQRMLTEMIRQHYNHPSVVMWCYMNEIFLRMSSEAGYAQKVAALAKSLEALARREDPGRLTAIALNRPYTADDPHETSGLLDIPQVVAWHMYFGWYYGQPDELGRFLDEQHRLHPRRKLLVSEYGADSDSRLHSLIPVRRDYTAEWAQAYHRSYVEQMEQRPYLGGYAIWSAFDFGSESRGEAEPHVNKKGVNTFDRQPKDVAYYYKARFSAEPVLHIATREWLTRTGANPETKPTGGKDGSVKQPVLVYTNLSEVELFINGVSLGTKPTATTREATWQVPFTNGVNTIEARGQFHSQNISDNVAVRFIRRASVLADPSVPFAELAVNVGSGAEYHDAGGVIWEADQPYTRGGWGHVGGNADRSNRNILGSPDDPLYQTFLHDIKEYRFDVPDGSYEVELRFVEHLHQKPGARVFSVLLNGKTVIENLDLFKSHGGMRAATQTVRTDAARGQGMTVQFKPGAGEPVLSAIRIRRLK